MWKIWLKLIPIGILFSLLFFQSFAQENCSNNIDDDADGLIDCQDPDCANFGTCKIVPSCSDPYLYYMPPIYGDKVYCDLFGSDDIVLTSLNNVASVKVMRGDGSLLQSLIIPVASPANISFPDVGVGSDQVLNPTLNSVLVNSGLIISSDQPLQVSYRQLSRAGCFQYNQDIMQIHGSPALGYSFYAGSQTNLSGLTNLGGAREKHFVSVMATENGTNITFTVPNTITLEGSADAAINNVPDWNGTRTITLNRGQTYIIGTQNEAPNQTISGIKITSDKPIVVNSGSQHTGNTQSSDSDAGLTQLIPATLVGKSYSVLDGGNSSSIKDYIILLGVKNNTTFTINGVSAATDALGNTIPASINAGGVVTYYFSDTQFASYSVQASNPIYVFHVSSQTLGEFGMEILPPLNTCIGNKKVDFSKPGDFARSIVYVPTSGLSSLKFRGQPYTTYASSINGNKANVIPTTQYSFVVFEDASILPTGNNRITCDQKMQVAVLAYTGGTGNYAYYSDYQKNIEIYDPETLKPTLAYVVGSVVPNTPFTHCLNMGGCGADNTILTAVAGSGGTVTINGKNCIQYTMNNSSPCFTETVTLKIVNELGVTSNLCLTFFSSNSNINSITPIPTTSTICSGGNITLNGTSTSSGVISNPSGYVWTTPFGTAVIGPILSLTNLAISQSGSYKLVVTDLVGCTRIYKTIIAVINCLDSDSDGVNNLADPDDDNDGIYDYVETCGIGATTFSCLTGNPTADDDADGILNYKDADFCILNAKGVCQNLDFDGDGVPNFFDLDSDNDGIPDVIESGGVDSNGDGVVDGVDLNNDGIKDNLGATGLILLDSDGDSKPNYLDLDADNDGIPDIKEVGGVDVDNDGKVDNFTDTGNGFADVNDPSKNGVPLISTSADTNNDGRADSYPVDNSDLDGVPNFMDVDSDNDGITDTREIGGKDSNGDGRIDGFTDANGDGLADSVTPLNGGIALLLFDKDSDNAPDYLDLDSDNDGISDIIESSGIALDPNNDGIVGPATFVDTDGDGLSNVVDANNGGTPGTNKDSDGDGVPNALDLDSDNNGVSDVFENGLSTFDNNKDGIIDGTDIDADGVINIIQLDNNTTYGGNFPLPSDIDKDDVLDAFDLDNDNDGLLDVRENKLNAQDVNNDGILDGPDTDGDGIVNSQDPTSFFGGNFPALFDTDKDGVGNLNDLDDDNDGVFDVQEQGFANVDTNKDGLIDGTTDVDNDGVRDLVGLDNGLGVGAISIGKDNDGDGVSNAFDLDSDNDGITDVDEAGLITLDINKDGIVNGTDTDGDGLINVAGIDTNAVFGGTGSSRLDTDGDSVFDLFDLDSDNDGIADVREAGLGALDADANGILNGIDSDGDGVINTGSVDTNNIFGATSPRPYNSDTDSKPDYIDIDSDNDGITDIDEVGLSALDVNNDGRADAADGDGDGLADAPAIDPNNIFGGKLTPPLKSDGDASPDYLDLDSDDDGIVDIIEGQSTISFREPSGQDADGDGLDNSYDVLNSTIPLDSDADGKPDYLDMDTDNDTRLDSREGYKPNKTLTGLDSDNDGLDNAYDADTGNTNDAGVTNRQIPQSFPDTDNPGGDRDWRQAYIFVDIDSDGIPNDLDLDDDNDGIPDLEEGVGVDTDGDGILNSNDLDSDGDTISDVIEGGGTDPDGDGRIGTGPIIDTNQDGLADTVDPVLGKPLPLPDCDENSIPDFLDSQACGIIVPEGFSPNGDGVNDTFVIGYLDGKRINLTVYNRWGNKVYQSQEYKNDWDGKSNYGLVTGDQLPDGTYFYIVTVDEVDQKPKYLTIKR